MTTNGTNRHKSKKQGAFSTATQTSAPFEDMEGFEKVLRVARWNAKEVSKLVAAEGQQRAQGRIRRHQSDTLSAINDYAIKNGLDSAKVAEQVARSIKAG